MSESEKQRRIAQCINSCSCYVCTVMRGVKQEELECIDPNEFLANAQSFVDGVKREKALPMVCVKGCEGEKFGASYHIKECPLSLKG